MRQRSAYLPIQHALVDVFTIVLLVFLAACGTNSGATTTTAGGGSNAITATGTSASATASSTGVTATPTRTLATQKCGTVHTMRLLIVPADANLAKGVENCFWQAFQTCHPAVMVFAQNSLDSGTVHNFSLQKSNGTCVITDGVQHFVLPRPASAATNYVCAGLTQQADGLHFQACGEAGNVLVPSVGAQ